MTSLAGDQDLLLRASSLDGPAAIEAWEVWRSRTRVDALDRDSQWLLPRLFWNLSALGVAPEALGRYRNVYRHHWYRNQITLRPLEVALRSLPRTVPRPVLLGGAAMALRHPDALGARPFTSLEWLADSKSQTVARVQSIRWRRVEWLVLDPADQLVDICLRRHAWDARSALFWLSDAAMILRDPTLDAARVSALAWQLGQPDQIHSALQTVGERTGITHIVTAMCSARMDLRKS